MIWGLCDLTFIKFPLFLTKEMILLVEFVIDLIADSPVNPELMLEIDLNFSELSLVDEHLSELGQDVVRDERSWNPQLLKFSELSEVLCKLSVFLSHGFDE